MGESEYRHLSSNAFCYPDKIPSHGDKRCGIKLEGTTRRDGVEVGTDGGYVYYLIPSTVPPPKL